jgi:hypothetical protein
MTYPGPPPVLRAGTEGSSRVCSRNPTNTSRTGGNWMECIECGDKSSQRRRNAMQHVERTKNESDIMMRLIEEGVTFEVKCLHCGHPEILTRTGRSATEEREYVGDGIFCYPGEFPPTYYKEEPYRCRGCGRELVIDPLSPKKISFD